MIKQSIITGDSASEFCVTRDDTDDLTIEFLWHGHRPTDKKSCTKYEAEQLRDALLQLYPLKEHVSSEKVEYKVSPPTAEWGSVWTVTAEFKNNNNYSTGQTLARFYDKQHAFDFVDLLKCQNLMKKTEKNFDDVFDINDELSRWNNNDYPDAEGPFDLVPNKD